MSTPPVIGRPAGRGQRSLSPFLLASIGLLVLVTIGAVVLLFVGTFEYRFSRVFATLIVFGLFTGLTGIDTSRVLASRKYYTPFALFANVYMLALSLVVIWVRDKPVTVMFLDFVGITLYVFALGRVALFGASVLLKAHAYGRRLLLATALGSAVLLAVCAVLFTIPVGMWAFHVDTPDLYWRICVALLIITALGVAVTSLLYWALSADERAARKQAHPSPYASHQPAPMPPSGAQPPGVRPYVGPRSAPAQTPQQATPPPQASPPAQGGAPQPWPMLPDGRPVPALPNGQPDFEALRRAVSDGSR